MVNDLMNEAAQLHVQRLEEKLLQAETLLGDKEQELQAMKDNHASEMDERRAEGEKSWTLVNHLMRTLKKSNDLMMAREDLVVAQAAKLKEVEKEVADYKEFVATNMANLITGSSKAVNISAEIAPEDEGNWEVLGQCQEVIEKQSSSIELLSTIAGYGVAKNNSLRFSEDEEGHLVSANLCQCCYNNDWSTHWSAWQYDDKCDKLSLTNGTSIECGEGGKKTRRRLNDVNLEVWKEEVEEVACQSCEDFAVDTHVCLNYTELNSPTRRRLANVAKKEHCDKRIERDWKGTGWYRITGEAGTKLVDSSVDVLHCGTYASGWLSGGHPTVDEGEVARTVNFNCYGDSSRWSVDVKVINCNTHFVYYLVDTPLCHLGYCTE